LLKKRRKISLEVRRPTLPADTKKKKKSGTGSTATTATTTTPPSSAAELADDEILFLRMFKQRRSGGGSKSGKTPTPVKPLFGRFGAGTDDDHLFRQHAASGGGYGASLAAGTTAGVENDGGDDDDDVSLASSLASDFLAAEGSGGASAPLWKEHRSYKLEDVEIINHSSVSSGGGGRVLELKTGSGVDTVVRDVKFESAEDALFFLRAFEQLMAKERVRTEHRIARYRQEKLALKIEKTEKNMKAAESKGNAKKKPTFKNAALAVAANREISAGLDGDKNGKVLSALEPKSKQLQQRRRDDERIKVLVEIVSAIDLPVADLSSSDPYIMVWLGGREVHRTSVVPKTLVRMRTEIILEVNEDVAANIRHPSSRCLSLAHFANKPFSSCLFVFVQDPIWTLKTGSLFYLNLTPEEFFRASGGMTMILKDFDAVGKDEELGRVTISLDDLLHGTGDRVEYEVVVSKVLHPRSSVLKPYALG